MGAEVAVAADEPGQLGEMPLPVGVLGEGLLMLIECWTPHGGSLPMR